jgi:hypothetical protein
LRVKKIITRKLRAGSPTKQASSNRQPTYLETTQNRMDKMNIVSSDNKDFPFQISGPKSRNYFKELSPEQQEEHRRLDAMIAEAERYRRIGEAVDMFESFQRSLETARFRPIPKVDPMPPRPRIRRRIEEPGPLLEEVMLARGLLHAVKRRSLNRNE